MKRLITLFLLFAFTTAVLPVNAFGPTPGQLEYQNNGYSPPYNQYGGFSNTPQQGSFSSTPQQGWGETRDGGSYGSFSNTPQQGWGNTRDDGSFNIPNESCNHWEKGEYEVDTWYNEYNDNEHIVYTEIEVRCKYCQQVYETFVEEDYKKHNFNNRNECKNCGYYAGCTHQWTSRQTPKYWYEIYDEHYHSEVYIEEEVCNYCGEVLDSQRKSKKWSHQYQYGRCWTCGYIQQSSSQPQYTSPVVNQPEYVEPEPEEKYVEEPVYVEQPQQNTTTKTTVLPYQQALQEGRAYAVTPDGLHILKRNYAPGTALGYADKYYCSINSIYAPLYLPADEVYEQKGDYLYRVSTGERVAASPSILKICDARISELKSTLKGLSDASSRVEQYKQVKKGQIPLTSIVEQNRSYIAKSNQSHSKVSEVQAKLQELGYTSQKDVTGKIDTKTLNNIAYFQSQNGILSTGWLDNETYNAIMSYGNSTSQVVDTSPYAEITSMYLENKELVISVQGNQYVKNIHIMPIYNGSIVGARSVYNKNSATVKIPITQSGQYVIELSVNDGNGKIYDAPKQEIYIDLPKGDGSTPLGVTGAFCLGLGDSLASSVQGVGNVILHPIKTIQSIGEFAGNLAATVVNAGSVGELRNQAVDALTEIITITWNQLDNNTTEENARVTGKVVGDIVIAVLVTKGLEKGTAALKASANSGKLAQTTKNVINGTDSVDDAARMLTGGGSLLDDLARSGVKYNADDVITVLRNSEGKLLWLEKGDYSTGLTHILEKHTDHFTRRGISNIPSLLEDILPTNPIRTGRNERGLFADYIFNGKSYRVVYGTNGYIVTFYPIN